MPPLPRSSATACDSASSHCKIHLQAKAGLQLWPLEESQLLSPPKKNYSTKHAPHLTNKREQRTVFWDIHCFFHFLRPVSLCSAPLRLTWRPPGCWSGRPGATSALPSRFPSPGTSRQPRDMPQSAVTLPESRRGEIKARVLPAGPGSQSSAPKTAHL